MATATLTINLGAIQRNWKALAGYSDTSTTTAAVVKADAYGLGVSRVAQALNSVGAKDFFVAAAEEGAEIRSVVPDASIYIFSGFMQNDAGVYAEHDLIPLLNSPDQLNSWLGSMGSRAFGLQLDTGMNRLGIEPGEFSAMGTATEQSCLLISHLACADEENHRMNQEQLSVFHQMTDTVVAKTDVRRSLAATGGILLGRDFHFDMVRPGIGLYGGLPFAAAESVVTLSLPVIQSRLVEPGETVGYGAAWQATKQTHVATLAAGYADGILRELSRNSCNDVTDAKQTVNLYASGIACPMVGRVSMDMITVDISSLVESTGIVPEAMELLNEEQGIDQLASLSNTIGYEILTSCWNRYSREYVGG